MAKLNESFTEKVKYRMRFIKKYAYIRLLISEKNRIMGEVSLKRYSDEEYVKKLFLRAFNKELDLINPKTFNEKLQWIKLNYKNPEMAICADKYEVREYLTERGYAYLLNDIFGVYETVDEIDLNQLPEKFVLKASHGSGWNIICEDKSSINWNAWIKVMSSWMKQNLYVYGREWVYKDIKPRIICEKYLDVKDGELFDYKFFCINGHVEFVQVTDNDEKSKRINLYDRQWSLMKEKYAFIGSPKIIPKPMRFDQMLEIAEALSKPFPFARIDLYDIDGEIVFGEITFFPSSGFKHFEPEGFDLELGNKLHLPKLGSK